MRNQEAHCSGTVCSSRREVTCVRDLRRKYDFVIEEDSDCKLRNNLIDTDRRTLNNRLDEIMVLLRESAQMVGFRCRS